MSKKALMGLGTTCALLMLNSSATSATTSDVVLYASDAANLHGNWTRISDATAAGGQLVSSVDRAWGSTGAALAAPADYFEFAFNAVANTPYHVWVRARAIANSKYNDSVYLQFSDAVDANGATLHTIGTSSGLTVNLATDAGATSLSEWGWQDGAYWLAQPTTISFASTGSHTLRIQTREDGVQIDQVVLSASTYLTTAPGSVTRDTKIVLKPIAASTPYTGSAASIPGTIEAENFDNGGEGIAFHDVTAGNSGGAYRQTDVDLEAATGGGYNVGWIGAGEWLKYSVNVATAGTYVLDARVAASGQGGTFHVEFNGQDATGALTIPDTGGWQNWMTVSTTVALATGAQLMRIVFDTPGANAVGNLNWVRLSSLSSSPFTGTAIAVPGTLRAQNFDSGREGVAYHDLTPGNSGGQYRTTDVDIEVSSLGGYDVGWMDTGEWLAYTVNVAAAGTYSLQFQVASAVGGGRLHANFGSTDSTVVDVSNTGGWQNWTTATATANLASGQQVMKLCIDAGGLNVAGITLALTTPPPPPPTPLPAVPTTAAVDGAVEVTVTPTLSWQSAGASSFALRFGTTNPPLAFLTDTVRYYYEASGLSTGTKYYWQVVARNAAGVVSGPMWSFTTEKDSTAPPGGTGAPLTYGAITDRVTRTKPALPVLGPAGFSFIDPSFGSTLVRVTDANTRPDRLNMSYRTPSAGHTVGWNATSTMFYVTSTDGTIVPYALDASHATASRMPGNGDGGLTLNFINDPEFSTTNPNVIYGVNSVIHTVSRYDFAAAAYSAVINLDTIVSGLSGYVGGQAAGGTTTDNLMVFFGGPQQDLHHYALWFPVNNLAAKKLLDTAVSTVNGVPTNVALNFNLHSASIDRSGRYVSLYPTAPDQAAPRHASQQYIWDTATDLFTALTSGGMDGGPDVHPWGHDAAGFAYNINKDCCTTSSWDAGQWQIRSLADPLVTADLISPVLTPKEVYMADHTSWNNAQPNVLVPVITGMYRAADNIDTTPWRAWDDEIIAVETGAPAGTGARVWRFAHHRSMITSDSPTISTNTFWYTARPNVSRNGRWVIFTSNWEKTLGSEPPPGIFRQDVFLIQLP
jgi:carbohydrate binding protein with CBM6 domain